MEKFVPNAPFANDCQVLGTIVTHAKDVVLDFALCCEVHTEDRLHGSISLLLLYEFE